MNFDRKTVMVTGAAGNLGRAVAQTFAEGGANLVLVDLDRARLESVFGADDAPGRLLAPADLLDRDQALATAQDGRRRRWPTCSPFSPPTRRARSTARRCR
jgi:NAD(P)-dependent dehydrogenase (short-subunit alcohol dehydrogenase family)